MNSLLLYNNLYKHTVDEKEMVYYFTRKSSDGVETVYVSKSKDLAQSLRREDAVVEFEALSLRDVEARIRCGKPSIEYTEDERYPGAILTTDVSLFRDYIDEAERIYELGEFHLDRVTWEDHRQKLLKELNSQKSK